MSNADISVLDDLMEASFSNEEALRFLKDPTTPDWVISHVARKLEPENASYYLFHKETQSWFLPALVHPASREGELAEWFWEALVRGFRGSATPQEPFLKSSAAFLSQATVSDQFIDALIERTYSAQQDPYDHPVYFWQFAAFCLSRGAGLAARESLPSEAFLLRTLEKIFTDPLPEEALERGRFSWLESALGYLTPSFSVKLFERWLEEENPTSWSKEMLAHIDHPHVFESGIFDRLFELDHPSVDFALYRSEHIHPDQFFRFLDRYTELDLRGDLRGSGGALGSRAIRFSGAVEVLWERRSYSLLAGVALEIDKAPEDLQIPILKAVLENYKDIWSAHTPGLARILYRRLGDEAGPVILKAKHHQVSQALARAALGNTGATFQALLRYPSIKVRSAAIPDSSQLGSLSSETKTALRDVILPAFAKDRAKSVRNRALALLSRFSASNVDAVYVVSEGLPTDVVTFIARMKPMPEDVFSALIVRIRKMPWSNDKTLLLQALGERQDLSAAQYAAVLSCGSDPASAVALESMPVGLEGVRGVLADFTPTGAKSTRAYVSRPEWDLRDRSRFLQSSNPEERMGLALRSPVLTRDEIVTLLGDSDADVRAAVTQNPLWLSFYLPLLLGAEDSNTSTGDLS